MRSVGFGRLCSGEPLNDLLLSGEPLTSRRSRRAATLSEMLRPALSRVVEDMHHSVTFDGELVSTALEVMGNGRIINVVADEARQLV